jgi:CoA:oxalate CoA-transferase
MHCVAMFHAQLVILKNVVARFIGFGDFPRRLGSSHPLIASFQPFSRMRFSHLNSDG